jgi:hypothetical protein
MAKYQWRNVAAIMSKSVNISPLCEKKTKNNRRHHGAIKTVLRHLSDLSGNRLCGGDIVAWISADHQAIKQRHVAKMLESGEKRQSERRCGEEAAAHGAAGITRRRRNNIVA